MGILFLIIGVLVGAIAVYFIMRSRQEKVKQINRAQLEAFDKEVQEKKIVTQRLIDSYDESLERAKQENDKALERARRYNQEQLKQIQSDYYSKVQDYTNQAEEQKSFLNKDIAELQARIVTLEKDYDHKIADFDRQWRALMKERREAMDKLEEENLENFLDRKQLSNVNSKQINQNFNLKLIICLLCAQALLKRKSANKNLKMSKTFIVFIFLLMLKRTLINCSVLPKSVTVNNLYAS